MAVPTIFRQPILDEKREITFIFAYLLYLLGIAVAFATRHFMLFKFAKPPLTIIDFFLVAFLVILFAFLPAAFYFLSVSFFRPFCHKVLAYILPLLIAEVLIILLTYLFIGGNYFYSYYIYFHTDPIFVLGVHFPLIFIGVVGLIVEYVYMPKAKDSNLLDDL
jgi:hypothetical protein